MTDEPHDRQALEIEKLVKENQKLDLENKKLAAPLLKTKVFWISAGTVAVTIIGLAANNYLTSIKTERALLKSELELRALDQEVLQLRRKVSELRREERALTENRVDILKLLSTAERHAGAARTAFKELSKQGAVVDSPVAKSLDRALSELERLLGSESTVREIAKFIAETRRIRDELNQSIQKPSSTKAELDSTLSLLQSVINQMKALRESCRLRSLREIGEEERKLLKEYSDNTRHLEATLSSMQVTIMVRLERCDYR